jgi:starvation-inducible DNA-binding protein
MVRIAAQGRTRTVRLGEVLVEQGNSVVPVFVVKTGELEIVRGATKTLVAAQRPSQFTDKIRVLSGRRAMAQMHLRQRGEVIDLDSEQQLAFGPNRAKLGEIIIRTLIPKGVEMISCGPGDVVLVGSSYSGATLQIKEFLISKGHPYSSIDLGRDADIQNPLVRLHVTGGGMPVVICRGAVILRNPTNRQVADCLGVNDTIDQAHVSLQRCVRGGNVKRVLRVRRAHPIVPRQSKRARAGIQSSPVWSPGEAGCASLRKGQLRNTENKRRSPMAKKQIDAKPTGKVSAQPRFHQHSEEIQPYGTVTHLLPLELEEPVRLEMTEQLNQLLADTLTLRDLYKKSHWQAAGPTIYQLHLLFDKHYGEQVELVDSIAELIQVLGGVSIAMAPDVAEITQIERAPRGREGVSVQLSRLLDAHKVIIGETRKLARLASELGDDGTNDLLVSEVLRTNELQVWFLSEHLVNVPLTEAKESPAAAGAA